MQLQHLFTHSAFNEDGNPLIMTPYNALNFNKPTKNLSGNLHDKRRYLLRGRRKEISLPYQNIRFDK